MERVECVVSIVPAGGQSDLCPMDRTNAADAVVPAAYGPNVEFTFSFSPEGTQAVKKIDPAAAKKAGIP